MISRKKVKIITAVIVISASITAVGLAYKDSDKKSGTEVKVLAVSVANDTTTGVSLSYKQPFTSEALAEQDRNDGFIFRLTSDEPPTIVSVRQEEGLRAVTAISGINMLELLTSNVQKAYPVRYPGFSTVSENKYDVSGKSAREVVFTYDGPSGQKVKQRFVIIQKDGNTAIYVTAQTTDEQYDAANSNYFNDLIESIQL
jgi:hypothetical protein